MDLKRYFDYNPMLDLTAAHIGINKWEWETIDSEDENAAKEKMKAKKFDVLPVSNKGKVNKYFSTRLWNNYDNLNLNFIEQSNLIYYRLSLSDLIRKFNEEGKHYYFLTDYKDVLGLVSFVNLNCQAVYNYLFQILADLERSIAYLLKDYIDQNEIIEVYKVSEDSHLKEVAKTFEDAVKAGKDSTIFEHMYLQTVGITLSKFCHKLPNNLKKLNKYSSKFSPNSTYGEIRNKIMHPVRPILNDNETISKIDELLNDYFDIKDIIEQMPATNKSIVASGADTAQHQQ